VNRVSAIHEAAPDVGVGRPPRQPSQTVRRLNRGERSGNVMRPSLRAKAECGVGLQRPIRRVGSESVGCEPPFAREDQPLTKGESRPLASRGSDPVEVLSIIASQPSEATACIKVPRRWPSRATHHPDDHARRLSYKKLDERHGALSFTSCGDVAATSCGDVAATRSSELLLPGRVESE
jgi:hypothetical protein